MHDLAVLAWSVPLAAPLARVVFVALTPPWRVRQSWLQWLWRWFVAVAAQTLAMAVCILVMKKM